MITLIEFKHGNVLLSGADFICHQVNCQGVMGKGLAKQIRDKYPQHYQDYIKICESYKTCKSFLLGHGFVTNVDNQKIIGLFAQLNYGTNKCQTSYNDLELCFTNLCAYIDENYDNTVRVAIPYLLGCGLAGGSWDEVYHIINLVFLNRENIILEIWNNA